MNQFEKCPFCGEAPFRLNGGPKCGNPKCFLNTGTHESWNDAYCWKRLREIKRETVLLRNQLEKIMNGRSDK